VGLGLRDSPEKEPVIRRRLWTMLYRWIKLSDVIIIYILLYLLITSSDVDVCGLMLYGVGLLRHIIHSSSYIPCGYEGVSVVL